MLMFCIFWYLWLVRVSVGVIVIELFVCMLIGLMFLME